MSKPAQFYKAESYNSWDSAGYLLKTAGHMFQPCLELAVADSGLTVTQWKVLMCVRDGLASTCADISRELPHDSGSLTRIVDGLEKKGFLERRRSASDRRVVALHITPSGREAVGAVIPYVVQMLNSALQDLSRAEITAFVDMLQRIVLRLRATDCMAEMAAIKLRVDAR